MIKATKDDVYIYLAGKYGWTPDIIANMNNEAQYKMCRGPRFQSMTPEEYAAFQNQQLRR